MTVNKKFNDFSKKASTISGRSYTFIAAISLILLWAASGPLLKFSDTWQLIINTLTTLITFLMVFLIQNTQNRDSTAIHLKLDELIHAVPKAREKIIDAEMRSDVELDELQQEEAAPQNVAPARNRSRQ